MKKQLFFLLIVTVTAIFSCSNKTYSSNGEKIYKTGKNLKGERLLDKASSRIKFVNSCQTCHGKNGTRLKGVSIKFSDLANATEFSVPYNDSLFYRFLDKDLKSDGSKADIGVIWKMNNQDKEDLLKYLKTL